MKNSTPDTIMKLMIALMTEPYEKSTPLIAKLIALSEFPSIPKIENTRATNGVMIESTSVETSELNATPITKAADISTMLPLLINSLNSCTVFFISLMLSV